MIQKTTFSLLRETTVPVNNRPVQQNLAVAVFDGVLVPRGDLTANGDGGVTITVDAELFIDFRLSFKYTDFVISTNGSGRWKFIKDFDYGSEMTFWLAKEQMT
jgi:hypothetical protein